MVQQQTKLKVADNTGAKELMCIRCLGGSHRKYAEVGDIITFIAPDTRYGGISITHRIIDKFYDESLGSYTYRTRGDNNNVADAALVPNDNILGKVILKVPKLGYIQDLLASKGGLIFVVLIPALVILSYDIMKIFKKVGQKTKLIKE